MENEVYFLHVNLDAMSFLVTYQHFPRTSSVMLNRSDKRRYPCLVSGPGWIGFSLSPLDMMLAVGFFVNTLTRLRKIFSVHNFLMFLSNMFYASIEKIMWFLSFVLIFLYYND